MAYEYKDYNEKKYETGFWNINRSKYKWFQNYAKLKIFSKWTDQCKNKDVFLDVGGGVGNWTAHFLKDFKKCIVLDISKKALSLIPEKEIIKLHGSVTKIPLRKNSVDCILLADVFEHIYEKDLPGMMSELNRILKKEGSIIIFTSEYGYGIDLILSKLFGTAKGRMTRADIECGHVNRLTLSEKEKLFSNEGFIIKSYYNYSIFLQQATDFIKDNFAKILSKFLGRKGDNTGQSIKDKFKIQKEPNVIIRTLLYIPTLISNLDTRLGNFIRGSSVFLLLEKRNK